MTTTPATREELRHLLESTRARTLDVVTRLTDEELSAQPSPSFGPIAWDLAHVAGIEAHWLVERMTGREARSFPRDPRFDPFENPRPVRGSMPLPSPREALAMLASVREETLEVLERDPLDPEDRLRRGGFAWRMVAQHESQHRETILQALDAHAPRPIDLAVDGPRLLAPAAGSTTVTISGGRHDLGTDDGAAAYDNERPSHGVDLEAFGIDRELVSNAQYADFCRDGGYGRAEWWSAEGRELVRASGLVAPRGWQRDGEGWVVRRFGRVCEWDPREPVQHVSAFEAEAFARWAGARLPTEAEWEAAVRARPELAGTLGSLYQWTSTRFAPYPGFEAFPYREYSVPFFDGRHRVLRGTSWAIAEAIDRPTYRNWDLPDRGHLFAGIRLARDA